MMFTATTAASDDGSCWALEEPLPVGGTTVRGKRVITASSARVEARGAAPPSPEAAHMTKDAVSASLQALFGVGFHAVSTAVPLPPRSVSPPRRRGGRGGRVSVAGSVAGSLWDGSSVVLDGVSPPRGSTLGGEPRSGDGTDRHDSSTSRSGGGGGGGDLPRLRAVASDGSGVGLQPRPDGKAKPQPASSDVTDWASLRSGTDAASVDITGPQLSAAAVAAALQAREARARGAWEAQLEAAPLVAPHHAAAAVDAPMLVPLAPSPPSLVRAFAPPGGYLAAVTATAATSTTVASTLPPPGLLPAPPHRRDASDAAATTADDDAEVGTALGGAADGELPDVDEPPVCAATVGMVDDAGSALEAARDADATAWPEVADARVDDAAAASERAVLEALVDEHTAAHAAWRVRVTANFEAPLAAAMSTVTHIEAAMAEAHTSAMFALSKLAAGAMAAAADGGGGGGSSHAALQAATIMSVYEAVVAPLRERLATTRATVAALSTAGYPTPHRVQ